MRTRTKSNMADVSLAILFIIGLRRTGASFRKAIVCLLHLHSRSKFQEFWQCMIRWNYQLTKQNWLVCDQEAVLLFNKFWFENKKRGRKVSGPFEKRAPGIENWVEYAILRVRMSLCLCLCDSENRAYSFCSGTSKESFACFIYSLSRSFSLKHFWETATWGKYARLSKLFLVLLKWALETL